VANFTKMRLLPLFIFIFFLFCAQISYAQEIDLEAYDPNTEILFRGKVKEIIIPERGMVSLLIEKDGKTYQAFLCPRWYYFKIRPNLKVGDEVEIIGAKIYSRRLGPALVIKVLKNLTSKEELILRRPTYEPCWRGGRFHSK